MPPDLKTLGHFFFVHSLIYNLKPALICPHGGSHSESPTQRFHSKQKPTIVLELSYQVLHFLLVLLVFFLHQCPNRRKFSINFFIILLVKSISKICFYKIFFEPRKWILQRTMAENTILLTRFYITDYCTVTSHLFYLYFYIIVLISPWQAS